MLLNCIYRLLYWQDMKNFVEQISIKFVIKINLVQLCCRQTHQNVGGNSYIGELIYQSVFNNILLNKINSDNASLSWVSFVKIRTAIE